MKTLGLVLVLVLALGVCGFAQTVNSTMNMQHNVSMLCVKNVPIDPNPEDLFDSSNYAPDYSMFVWNGGGYFEYDPGNPTVFGNILLGTGYVYNLPKGVNSDSDVIFTALPDGVPDASGNKTDMYFSFPKAGNYLIGCPFANNLNIDDGDQNGTNVLWTNGSVTLQWGDACDSGAPGGQWCNPVMQRWNGGGYTNLWNDGSSDSGLMYAGSAYWVTTYQPNLAMIICAKDPNGNPTEVSSVNP